MLVELGECQPWNLDNNNIKLLLHSVYNCETWQLCLYRCFIAFFTLRNPFFIWIPHMISFIYIITLLFLSDDTFLYICVFDSKVVDN